MRCVEVKSRERWRNIYLFFAWWAKEVKQPNVMEIKKGKEKREKSKNIGKIFQYCYCKKTKGKAFFLSLHLVEANISFFSLSFLSDWWIGSVEERIVSSCRASVELNPIKIVEYNFSLFFSSELLILGEKNGIVSKIMRWWNFIDFGTLPSWPKLSFFLFLALTCSVSVERGKGECGKLETWNGNFIRQGSNKRLMMCSASSILRIVKIAISLCVRRLSCDDENAERAI